jgi:uracil-DNA glycosylase family 4
LKKKENDPLKAAADRLAFFQEMGGGFVLRRGKKPTVVLEMTGDAVRAAERVRVPEPRVASVPAGAFPPPPQVSFPELEEKVLSCRLCPLFSSRTRAVPGEGDKGAELMFIGEAPGRDEDAAGRPFVGRAGQLLTKIIEAMKWRREEVYITNVVKCRPPDNRTPLPAEVEKCSPYLVRQIELIRPKVIVTLGKVATDFFIPGRMSMGERRGKFVDHQGIRIMPTFHPSYVVRNEGNKEIKKMVWRDMKLVMEFLGKK